jgi:D-aspartate ligase
VDPIGKRAMPYALVLAPDPEFRPTALGIIRSLGSAGVPVAVAASSRTTPSFCSRHVRRRLVCPPMEQTPERWKDALIRFAESFDDKPVLFPSADEQVLAIHYYRAELSRCFRYSFLEREALLACLDKRKMYEICRSAGIDTGQVLPISAGARPEEIALAAVFPSVLKPAMWADPNDERPHRNREFTQEFQQKAVTVNTSKELSGLLGRTARLSIPLVLQELVPGPASAIVQVSLYADKTSNIRGLFVSRKARQFPSQFGNACMIERTVCPEIDGLVKSLVKALGFHGIAGGVEFKRHPRTGRLHFIEINPRAAASISVTAANGVNLPYLAYLDALGAPLPDMPLSARSVRWIDGRGDLLYWLSYRKGDHTGEPLSLLQYLRSLRGLRDLRTGPSTILFRGSHGSVNFRAIYCAGCCIDEQRIIEATDCGFSQGSFSMTPEAPITFAVNF